MIRKPRTRGKTPPASKREGARVAYVRVAAENVEQTRDALLAKGEKLGLPHVQCEHLRAGGAKSGALIHCGHAVNLELCSECAADLVSGVGPAYMRMIGKAAESTKPGAPAGGYQASIIIEGTKLKGVLDAVGAIEPDAFKGYLILQFLASSMARRHNMSAEETAEQAALSWGAFPPR